MTDTKRHPALIGPRPPKQMLAEIILDQIASGELTAGDKLPSIRELVAAYWVAPNTVRGAFGILADAGLIEAHQGHGTFVTADAA